MDVVKMFLKQFMVVWAVVSWRAESLQVLFQPRPQQIVSLINTPSVWISKLIWFKVRVGWNENMQALGPPRNTMTYTGSIQLL